jgi:hypothetical protein
MRHRCLALCVALVPLRLFAADYVQTQVGGKAEVRISADRVDGDTAIIPLVQDREVKLTITLLGYPADEKNTLEMIDQRLVVSNLWISLKPKVTAAKDKSRWEVEYLLDPRPPFPATQASSGSSSEILGGGTLELPLISFQDATGASLEAHWKPIKISFTTSGDNPDNPSPAQTKGVGDPEEPDTPPRKPWWKWVVYGVALAVLLASLTATLVLYLRWRKEEKALTPRDLALREITQLQEQRLPESGQAERYYTQLSDIVRSYLERQFRLRAPQQTTPEFLAAMQSWPLLPAPQQQLLRTFLERCDMVKFAKVAPTPEECQTAAVMAQQIVEYTPPGSNGTAITPTPGHLQSPDATTGPDQHSRPDVPPAG